MRHSLMEATKALEEIERMESEAEALISA